MNTLRIEKRNKKRTATVIAVSVVTILLITALFGLAVSAANPAAPQATPPATIPGWEYSIDDCNGVDYQSEDPEPGGLPGNCQTYAGDVYENVDWVNPGKNEECADIDSFQLTSNTEWIFVQYTMSGNFTTSGGVGDNTCVGIDMGIEFDLDASVENSPGPRGDYYFNGGMSENCDNSAWQDAEGGGWSAYVDNDNRIGGNNPNTGFGCSGCAGDPGESDGYETDHTDTGNPDILYCRIVPSGNGDKSGYQIAFPRSFFSGQGTGDNVPDLGAYPDPDVRVRAWTAQSTSLSKDKLYWHDENASDGLSHGSGDYDNTLWNAPPTAVTLANLDAAYADVNIADVSLILLMLAGGALVGFLLYRQRRLN